MKKVFKREQVFRKTSFGILYRISSYALITIGIFLCSIFLNACSDDDKDEHPGVNKFSYDGKSYEAVAAEQYYVGHYEDYGDDANNIELYIGSEEFVIFFEMFVPNGTSRLVAGDYAQNNYCQPYTYLGGVVTDGDKNYNVKSGRVSIEVSGNTYTIEVDCELDGDKKLIGNYTGSVSWFDESEDEAENNTTAYGTVIVDRDNSQQTYSLGLATQYMMEPSHGNYFAVNFQKIAGFECGIGFTTEDKSTTTLPAGNYDVLSYAMGDGGTCNGFIKLPGNTTSWNSNSGWVKVEKESNNYKMTFSFETYNPVATVTGSYSGPIPLVNLSGSAVSLKKVKNIDYLNSSIYSSILIQL